MNIFHDPFNITFFDFESKVVTAGEQLCVLNDLILDVNSFIS